MRNGLKISHHKNSGRLKSHEHTSYLPLFVLLVVVGILLSLSSLVLVTNAEPTDGTPKSGSIGLTGVMPGKPPTESPTITEPSGGKHFSTSPITISGTCPANTLIEVFKNDIFAGSSPCSESGNFTFEIDLLIGQNKLIARAYDDLNQAGPDSNSVIVFYDALPPQASSLSPLILGDHLLLNTDAVFRGASPGSELNIPVEIIGGSPPFALNVQWGDTNNKVVPRNDNQPFKVGHTYNRPGTYQVSLQASDAKGRTAFLSVASIVNGQLVATTNEPPKNVVNKLFVLWPLYVASIAIVVSFWLGEKREKKILKGYTYTALN